MNEISDVSNWDLRPKVFCESGAVHSYLNVSQGDKPSDVEWNQRVLDNLDDALNIWSWLGEYGRTGLIRLDSSERLSDLMQSDSKQSVI
jgi:hypothetical protein